MKIESILIRKGGTKVSLGDTEYHFKPDETGRHVAEVGDSEHIATFLSIKEGYRFVPEAKQANAGDGASGVETQGDGDNFDTLDRVALAELYKKRFGDFPAANLSKAKIIDALRQPEA